MKTIGEELIDGMKEFLHKLQSGEPIKATRVTREEIPDGPLHARTHLTNARLLRMAERFKPPQEWYDTDEESLFWREVNRGRGEVS